MYQRMCQQQNQWGQNCYGVPLNPQVVSEGSETYPSEIETGQITTAAYINKSSTDSFCMISPNIQFGSLQPLG